MKPRTIYILQPTGGGHIKVGATERVGVRARQIAKLFPYGVEVLATMEGDTVTEAFIHACFRPVATATEWFASGPALWKFVLDVIEHGRPAYVPVRGLVEVGSLRAELDAEFGDFNEMKRVFGYSDTIAATAIFNHQVSSVLLARWACYKALRDGTLPRYISDLHPSGLAFSQRSRPREAA